MAIRRWICHSFTYVRAYIKNLKKSKNPAAALGEIADFEA